MSIRIALDNQPEFYTNLDHVAGRVVVGLNRSEQVASIVVKLEGEAVTALQVPSPYSPDASLGPPGPMPGPPGSVVSENHKILYRVQQVFPDEYHASANSPYGAFPLLPGEHQFPFRFKLPINNACSDPTAMSRLGGLGGLGGFGSGSGLFGTGGVRSVPLPHISKGKMRGWSRTASSDEAQETAWRRKGWVCALDTVQLGKRTINDI